MSNAAEWLEDKYAEIDLWLKEVEFLAFIGKYPIPGDYADRAFELMRLRLLYEREQREQNESKNQ